MQQAKTKEQITGSREQAKAIKQDFQVSQRPAGLPREAR